MMELLQPQKRTSAERVAWFFRERWVLLPILALAALVRFYDMTGPAIWYDEAASVLMSEFSLPLIWSHTTYDVHPPLYYLLLHGWTAAFGNGVFALRAMSVLAGGVTVGLGVWLVRLIATRRAAVLAGLLLALLPIAVRYSQEVRMYALQGAWLMGATIALIYWIKHPQQHRYLVVYTLLMTAGLYTHYFAGLCVVSHWLYLLLLRFQPSRTCHLITRPAWWIANAAVVVLYLPWVPHLINQLSLTGEVGWIPPVTVFSVPSIIWESLTLNDGRGLPWPIFIALPVWVLLASGWSVLRDKGTYKLHALLAIYTFVPIGVVFLISFKHSFFVPRYFMFAVIGLPLMLAIALDRLAHRYRTLAIVCLSVLVGGEGVGLYNVYTQTNKLNDTVNQPNNQIDRTTDYINQHFATGDRIVVNDIYWYLSVAYYNKTGTNPLLYTPPLSTGESGRPGEQAEGALLYQDADALYVDNLGSLPSETKRVWVVQGSEPDEAMTVPKNWLPVSALTTGDTQVWLYAVCTTAVCGPLRAASH